MQPSTVILTNKSGTCTVQIHYAANVKLELTNNSLFVLSHSKDDICAFVNFLYTLSFSFKSVTSAPSQLPMYVAKSPCSPMYGRLVR